jgi:signal transduction histidine kinase
VSSLLDLYRQAPARPDPADLRAALVPMLDGLSRALGYTRALVALYDPVRDALRGSVGLNVPEALAESLEVPLAMEGHPLVRAIVEGTPQRVAGVWAEAGMREHNRALLAELGMDSFVVAPLHSGISGGSGSFAAPAPGARRAAGNGGPPARPARPGRDVPAVGVVLLSKDGEITDQDIEWLMPFATQAGVALARATAAEIQRSSTEQYAIENEWLWLMINAVDDPVIVTDAQNNIVKQNRRADTLFRTGPEDSEGKRHAIRMNNFLFTAALSAWSVEQGQRRANPELTLVDPIEGTELFYEVIAYPAPHYRLGTYGIVSVLKNVTDLRRATEQIERNVQLLQAAGEAVRLERDRLDQILRSVPDPIVVVDVLDTAHQGIRMNQAASRLFQPSIEGSPGPPAAASRRRAQIALSNDARFTSFLAQRRLDPTQGKQGEIQLVDPDTAQPLAMWVTSSEIYDELGAVTGIISLMHDLGPLRELEQRRVEQALFESEKLAAQGWLAASIAHEINNPLEAIKNVFYLLVHKLPEDDPNAKFLQLALRETNRVSRILSQMLGFYRPAASMAPTDVNALIEEAEALLASHLKQRGVRVHNQLSPALPPVTASADQLKQVVLNLLLNAQQAMPDGGDVYVATHFAREADPEFLRSDAVRLEVRDSGAGIAEDIMPRIFQPFFSTKQDERGSGLGLWVADGIVRSHGGTIKVRSRPGRGTTFTISLPIGGPAPNAPAAPNAPNACDTHDARSTDHARAAQNTHSTDHAHDARDARDAGDAHAPQE